MKDNFDPSVLEGYLKIKQFIKAFSSLKGDAKSSLMIDIDTMKKNIRRSLVVKEIENDYFPRTM